MSKKPSKQNKSKNQPTKYKKDSTIPVYGDPTQKVWGKAVIWILIFAMGGMIIAGVILLIIFG